MGSSINSGYAVARVLIATAFAFALPACGSKTGLRVPDELDAGSFDGGAAVDAARQDAAMAPDGGTDPDICVELPVRMPRSVQVSFAGRIQSADVYFLVDTTGSMGEEIRQIRRSLQDVIIPGLVAAIPDVRFSVASLADFPEIGTASDVPYLLVQGSTRDVAAVQSAVNRLPASVGGDGPESQVEALYLSATGEGFGDRVIPASCPVGTVGYPCFRRDGSRIFLLFTDWAFHNGPGGSNPYPGGDLAIRPTPHTYDDAVRELRAIGAKVLGIWSGGDSDTGRPDVEAVARDTGAIDPSSGQGLVFDIGSDGSGLDSTVVTAVQTLVNEVPIDVDLVLEDVPGDAFDAPSFVQAIRATSADPASGATVAGDRFRAVRPGTRVTFTLDLLNDRLPEGPARFPLRVVVRGDGVTRLQETLVEIVIPPGDACRVGN